MLLSLSPNEQARLQAIIETAKERGQKIRRALMASAQANAKDNKDGAIGGGG